MGGRPNGLGLDDHLVAALGIRLTRVLDDGAEVGVTDVVGGGALVLVEAEVGFVPGDGVFALGVAGTTTPGGFVMGTLVPGLEEVIVGVVQHGAGLPRGGAEGVPLMEITEGEDGV